MCFTGFSMLFCSYARLHRVWKSASLLDTRIGPVFSRIPGNTNPSDTANKTELTWTNHDKFTMFIEFEKYIDRKNKFL